jgi:hypothetical protein
MVTTNSTKLSLVTITVGLVEEAVVVGLVVDVEGDEEVVEV